MVSKSYHFGQRRHILDARGCYRLSTGQYRQLGRCSCGSRIAGRGDDAGSAIEQLLFRFWDHRDAYTHDRSQRHK